MSQRPLPHVPGEVPNEGANAPAGRRPRAREATRDGLAYLVCALLAGALLAATAVGAPLWTHKPAGDIKWYRVTDVGSLLVGAKGALYALDGETGRQVAGLTALAYTSATASAANTYSGTAENRWANRQRINSPVAYEQFVGRRYSATKQAGNYVYVLTTVR